ncbi:hypothetical protein LVJ82_03070 [Vitreoscilla massiliensis]|uniref:Lipoprotein n=1 Tax=Vitreoscilla massiliensis TaxID=1689272 RepID=A0ABY4E3A0_9NEIS|nr:hypothetical protein [Vitreoscilla massiliensis]UOO89984.1 hypothetical protein LVJ82_03070 [Vitreoscilla massiliensis]
MWQKWQVWCVLPCLLGANACTTMMWEGNSSKDYAYAFKTVQADRLLSVGKIQERGQTEQYVLLGQSHVYVITDGNREISQILRLVHNPHALQLVTSQDKAIKLGLSPQLSSAGEAQFVGKLQLQYTIPNSDTAQLAAWKELPYYKMSPQAEQTVFTSSIRVFVTPYANNTQADNIAHTTAIAGDYQILLGSYETTTTLDVLQVLNNAFATPFTLAADLVTMPVGVVNQGVGKGWSQLKQK